MLTEDRKFNEELARREGVVDRDPKDIDARSALSQLLAGASRFVEAIGTLREAIKIAPDEPDLHLNFGRLLKDLGHPGEAVLALQAELRLSPGNTEAALEESTVWERMGDVANAMRAVNAALALNPSSEQLQKQKQKLDEMWRGDHLVFVRSLYLAMYSSMLIPEVMITLPKCLIYTNFDTVAPDIGAAILRHLYVQKARLLPQISLCRLDASVKVFVPDYEEIIPICGNLVVADQFRPAWGESEIRQVIEACDQVDHIEGAIVLIARFGYRTWGHWLGELLPKIVALESRKPGHFRYLVPELFRASDESKTAVESLGYYGITPDRTIFATPRTRYSIPELYTVTSVWTDDRMAIHPAAAQLMRTASTVPHTKNPLWRKIALLRRKAVTRNIANLQEVEHLLLSNGWTIVDIEDMNFRDQVDLFRSAERIVAVLGSNLTGLLYSPEHVKVLTLAPREWRDAFFYALMQERQAEFVDIRGITLADAPNKIASASFQVDIEAIKMGLIAMGEHVEGSGQHSARAANNPDVKSNTLPVVAIENDVPSIGDTLTTLPFIMALSTRTHRTVHVRGQFDQAVKGLVTNLPISFLNPNHEAETEEFVINIKRSREYAKLNKIDLMQAHFAVAGLPVPELPISLPLNPEHCDLPPGLVIAPFAAAGASAAANHIETWLVDRWNIVVDFLLSSGYAETAYVIGSPNDDPTPFLRPAVAPVIGYPLGQVLDLMRRAPLCVTLDPGISHLAHLGAIDHHVLICPEVDQPTLPRNPRGKILRGRPSDLTADQVIAACIEKMRV
jgi:tetratricopeptide (TPR) repeat protein